MSNEKKVIEQIKYHSIRVIDRNRSDKGDIILEQNKSGIAPVYIGIHKDSKRELALAICPELSQPEKTMQSWKHRPTEKDEPIGYLLNGSFILASDVHKPFEDDDTVVRLYGDPSAEIERLRKENEAHRELLEAANDAYNSMPHRFTDRLTDALNDIKEHLKTK